MIKTKITLFWILLLTISACGSKAQEKDDDNKEDNENVKVELKFDEESATSYHLTHINHKDKNGELLKLELAQTIEKEGETVVDFSKRMNHPSVVINASQSYTIEAGEIKALDVQIVNKVVVQEQHTSYYANTLGIKDNNELLAFKNKGVSASDMLKAGVNHALGGFVPLIENHKRVSDGVLNLTAAIQKPHPRQIIAQLDNLDLLILSCGGRGYGGEGMSANDVIRILQEYDKDIKFAFMLDGGGSVTTVINGKLITKRIDGSGTKLRPRANFLYIE